MKEWLYKVRTPNDRKKLSVQITYSILILLLGIALGIFSKWLDNMGIDDAIWWQHILGTIDLGNVFSDFAIWLLIALAISVYCSSPLRAGLNVFLFFTGMCASYHLYTIMFAGFNPGSYMMIWYGITLLSPILAFICWFGKGKTKISLIIDILIYTVMISACFSIGFWYFDITSIINVIIFIGSVAIMYSAPKQTVISLLGAVVLAYALRMFI